MFEGDQALSVSGDDKILVKVVQGVGTTPTFSWNKPVYNGRHPDLYVPTVVKVDANNAYLKTIWRGVTTETSVQFPALNQAVLQTGGRYVFYVMAYAAWERKMTTGEVFWYPESEVYWTSRSEGVTFEP